MGLQFGNPVVGGVTLVRPAIQSPNYLATLAGWTVNQDGSAEFNNVAIRGGLIEGAPGLYYNGTPAADNLVASVSATSFTDQFGNVVLAGEATYKFNSVGPSGSLAIAVNNGQIGWYAAASGTLGPWTLESSIASFNIVPGMFIAASVLQLASGDGNTYQLGELEADATALPQTINQVTAQTITGCTANLAARNYRVRATVQFTANAAAGNPSLQLGVSAAGTVWGNAIIWQTTGTGAGANRFVVDTSGAVFQGPGMVSGAVYLAMLDCRLKLTGTGAVSLQAFTSVAADTFTINNAVLSVGAR